jgi:hypothetical protein
MGMANIGYLVSLSLVVFPKGSAIFKVWWPIAGVGALLYILWGDRRLQLKMAARRVTNSGDSGHAEDPPGPWRSIAAAYVIVAFVLPFVIGYARWAFVTVQSKEASLPAQSVASDVPRNVKGPRRTVPNSPHAG